jgi:hypothetical protein
LITQFTGDGDFAEWIKKVELVSKLQKLDEIEKFLPLFLSGGAFAVYQSFDEDVKNDYERLKSALLKAFSINPFKAYNEFKSRTLNCGESVDVYLSDLQRLANLICKNVPDDLIKCAFIDGLPHEIQSQLVAACTLNEMGIHEVVEKARCLFNASTVDMGASAIVRRMQTDDQPSQSGVQPVKRVYCFHCRGEGHVARNCPEKPHLFNGAGSSLKLVRCYNCDEMGHMANSCPSRKHTKYSKN